MSREELSDFTHKLSMLSMDGVELSTRQHITTADLNETAFRQPPLFSNSLLPGRYCGGFGSGTDLEPAPHSLLGLNIWYVCSPRRAARSGLAKQ
jgi:hypothetical protein